MENFERVHARRLVNRRADGKKFNVPVKSFKLAAHSRDARAAVALRLGHHLLIRRVTALLDNVGDLGDFAAENILQSPLQSRPTVQANERCCPQLVRPERDL